MKYTNELIGEDSPYLLQHAHNPVNWMSWNDKSLQKAKEENKLIFLSIGYSTCHWCHVMEKESFENEAIAMRVNQNYISIKVDREEMPHIDKYYQDVHYLLTKRSGGWPLSIIMTPSQEVIFAATYLPPHSRNNMMGISELTDLIADKYRNDNDEIQKSAHSIKNAIAHYVEQKKDIKPLSKTIVDTFISNTQKSFDTEFKGIGSAPKFPHASTFDTLIDIHNITHSYEPLHMVLEAFEAMAQGGIYDQIEGGFYRYSVDEAWMIPHFEKMLYTNAELIESYAKLYKIENNLLFKAVVEESIASMNERFLKEGLYLSASDADSDGVEGRYFVFDYNEAFDALTKEGINASEALAYFGITRLGNFEHGFSNPHIIGENKPSNILHVKKILKTLRSQIKYPFIDYKILTSWNALMISALFEAGRNIDKKYADDAMLSLTALLETLHVKDVLYHQLVFGSTLKVKGLLEDYAFLMDALLKAHQYTLEEKYLTLAYKLSLESIEKFYKNDMWYLSDGDFQASAPLEDSSYKSALAKMIQNLFTLSLLKEDNAMLECAKEMLENISGSLVKYPHAYAEALKGSFYLLYGQIVIKTSLEQSLHVKEMLKSIAYPYIYLKIDEEKAFHACSHERCFYHGSDMEELKKHIFDYLK